MLASTQVDVQLYTVAVSRACASFLLLDYRQTEVVGSLLAALCSVDRQSSHLGAEHNPIELVLGSFDRGTLTHAYPRYGTGEQWAFGPGVQLVQQANSGQTLNGSCVCR